MKKPIEIPYSHATIPLNTHSFKQQLENETLPPADEIFDESQELRFEILDKKISLDKGDYSDCPDEWKEKVKALVADFADRFSQTKLDLEVTDKYTV